MPNEKKRLLFFKLSYVHVRNTGTLSLGKKNKCVESIVKIDSFFDKMLKQIKINKIKLSHCLDARGQLLALCHIAWHTGRPPVNNWFSTFVMMHCQ